MCENNYLHYLYELFPLDAVHEDDRHHLPETVNRALWQQASGNGFAKRDVDGISLHVQKAVSPLADKVQGGDKIIVNYNYAQGAFDIVVRRGDKTVDRTQVKAHVPKLALPTLQPGASPV